jgi:DNA-binding PadR family transcriptional regulator
LSKVKSTVPRGFTRFYTLYLISKRPMTGKEIMKEAEKRSEGAWRPSPGLIYPLLGRLLRDELILENDGGKFVITEAGEKALKQHSKFQSQLEKQFSLVTKLGLSMFTAGKLLAEESMDRILGVTQIMKERVSSGSADLQERFYVRYKAFLENELEKIERAEPWEAEAPEDERPGSP